MPPLKQMVKTSEVEIAQRRRKCAFTQQAILGGTPCLVVYEGDRDRFCYSREVGLRMITKARIRLDELERELIPDPKPAT